MLVVIVTVLFASTTLAVQLIKADGWTAVPWNLLVYDIPGVLIGGQIGRAGEWSLDTVYKLFPVLQERRNQASTSLSGGQQQMVAIGRALMANPDLLLLDEVSLGLAPVVIKSIYEALPQIVDGGMSAVIVEQDISKALSVSTRFYCLQEGRVSLEGKSGSKSREEISRAYFGV